MTRVRAAAVAAGALLAAGAAAAIPVLLARQAAIARRRIGKPLGELAPDADRVWQRAHEGEPVELLLLGDSIAAGLGAEHRKETFGGRLSKGIARRTRRPVRLRTAAVVGSESSDLAAQLDALPDTYVADLAVVVVGGNDVTHRIPVAQSVEHLVTAIERLRARGSAVVVATCPDLGALRAVPQPLRSIASRLSRQLADAQADAAVRAGAHAFSLRRTVGAMFLSAPDEMFALDRFHPSATGYARTVDALLPVAFAALAAGAGGGSRFSSAPRTPVDARGVQTVG